jgi:hypothetical protein
MAPRYTGAGSLPSGGQQSDSRDSSSDVTSDASPSLRATSEPTECPQMNLQADIDLITAYLVKAKVQDNVLVVLEHVQTVYKKHADQNTTEQTIQEIHQLVQQLTQRLNELPTANTGSYNPPSSRGTYADTARRGAGKSSNTRQQSCSKGSNWSVRSVLTRHKREIIVVQGEETAAQVQRTGKELAEQLNNTGIEGQIVAIRCLPSRDTLLTIDNENTRNTWLKDTK